MGGVATMIIIRWKEEESSTFSEKKFHYECHARNFLSDLLHIGSFEAQMMEEHGCYRSSKFMSFEQIISSLCEGHIVTFESSSEMVETKSYLDRQGFSYEQNNSTPSDQGVLFYLKITGDLNRE